jgi:hypothetical protein
MKNHRYWSSNCKGCRLKEKCTPSAQRRVTRWEHQDVLDDMQARLEQSPDAMRVRRSTVEHPFGTIKAWMGSTHFLTKGLDRVKTEMSLHVLAYNLKRLMAILGIASMMNAIRAHALFVKLQGLLWSITLLASQKSRREVTTSHNASLHSKTSRFLVQLCFQRSILSFYTAWAQSGQWRAEGSSICFIVLTLKEASVTLHWNGAASDFIWRTWMDTCDAYRP